MHISITPHPAPAAWRAHASSPHRACDLCRSGYDLPADGTRCCGHASVATHGQVVHVVTARAKGGACGPEAHHLDFPGLRP